MIGQLFRAEWLKLRKRPLAVGLLALFLGLLVTYLGLWAMVVALHEGALGGVAIEALSPQQVAEIKRQLSFPGVFGAVLGQVNSIGGILAVILAAGSLGSDYGWGTLRVMLSRSPDRAAYLLAKLLALLLGLLLACAVALVAGALIALGASVWLGLPVALTAGDLAALPVGVARALFVILPYLLATLSAAAYGRSVLAGIGGGLIFLALDVSAGSVSVLGQISAEARAAVNLLLQPNINALVIQNQQLFGLSPEVFTSALNRDLLPPPFQAVVVVSVYCALFSFGAWYAITRRDVTGAQ